VLIRPPARPADRKVVVHPSVQGRPALPKPPSTARTPSVEAMRTEDTRPGGPQRGRVKTFTVAPIPLGSEVWLDGKKVFTVDIGRNTIDVPWDREHLVEVRNDSCCEPMPFRLGPDLPPQEDRLVAPLRRKAARLRVKLTPAPLTPTHMDYVVLPERPGSTHTPFSANEELFISFDATGEVGKSLLVSVYRDGKDVLPIRKVVQIKPGQNISVEIPLVE
jgi:hypothetical protein